MTSQPAAGALCTIVLGELCDFSVATFRHKIERCAEGGGDGGLTRATTRAACGLPAEDVVLHPDGARHGGAPRPGAGRGGEAGTWLAAGRRRGACLLPCVSLVKCCLERGWDFCSEHHVSRLHQEVWRRVPARNRVGTLRQLKARGWWKELPPRGRSGAPLIPRIPRERGVLNLSSRLCWTAPNPSHTSKTLSADPCVSWCECVALIRQLVKLQEACDAKANHKGHGVMNAMVVVEMKNGSRKPRKYPSHLAWMTAVRDKVAVVETDDVAHLVLSQGGTTIANLVRYQHKVGNLGRHYSSPLGAQRCSNLVRAHVPPPATEEFDMVNAMTNLVAQAVRKMDLTS